MYMLYVMLLCDYKTPMIFIQYMYSTCDMHVSFTHTNTNIYKHTIVHIHAHIPMHIIRL